MIQGTLSFYNYTTCALIDTGTTRFYASSKFIRNLEIKPKPLGQVLIVETTLEDFWKHTLSIKIIE